MISSFIVLHIRITIYMFKHIHIHKRMNIDIEPIQNCYMISLSMKQITVNYKLKHVESLSSNASKLMGCANNLATCVFHKGMIIILVQLQSECR